MRFRISCTIFIAWIAGILRMPIYNRQTKTITIRNLTYPATEFIKEKIKEERSASCKANSDNGDK